ncbi:hypothetical protein RI367_005091 [Sorochytrium milnesiophthora]
MPPPAVNTWRENEKVQDTTMAIQKLALFLNEFECQARNQLQQIDASLTKLERRLFVVGSKKEKNKKVIGVKRAVGLQSATLMTPPASPFAAGTDAQPAADDDTAAADALSTSMEEMLNRVGEPLQDDKAAADDAAQDNANPTEQDEHKADGE